MKNYMILLVAGSFILATSCSDNKDVEPAVPEVPTGPSQPSDSLPSVETNSPNSNYRPAFAGQVGVARSSQCILGSRCVAQRHDPPGCTG